MTERVRSDASVDDEASLPPSCTIGEGARLLGPVKVGERVRIEPNAVVYGPATIGPGSFIGPNVVLGFPPKEELADSFRRQRAVHAALNRLQVIIGRGCVIRSGTCVYSQVSVGDMVSFGHNVMIREKVRIGKNSLVGTGVVVDGSCDIGEWVSIQTGGYICANCRIEDSVFLGPHVVLTNDKYVAQKKTKLVGPTIRKGASIGANSLLMSAIEIGEGSVIGAHSLVMNNVPARSIYAGVPAKKLRKVPSDWQSSLLHS